MKSKDAGLLKPLLTGQGSAETALYDFLYIDRERISSFRHNYSHKGHSHR
jgi:hypothetical protein